MRKVTKGTARRGAGLLLLAAMLCGGGSAPSAHGMHGPAEGRLEAGPKRPFFVGERLVYRIRVAGVGSVGQATMEVEKTEEVRGRPTLLLRFDFRSRVGLVTVRDHTKSWLDPQAMAALRFEKEERHPLSSRKQAVEIFPAERRWESVDGTRGASPTDAPLDELSFIYFIRTLPLRANEEYLLERHFEAGRNPVRVSVVRREEITVPAGTFAVVVVEMRVNDQQRFRGSDGLVRFYLTDDACRIPLRIESTLPVFGSLVMSLESHTHPREHLAAN